MKQLDPWSHDFCTLGAHIMDWGIHVLPSTLEKLQSWSEPKCTHNILHFMGTISFVAEHVPDLMTIAAPLTWLTSKVPWQWGEEEAAAFWKLKDLVPAVLCPIDWSKITSSGWSCLFLLMLA